MLGFQYVNSVIEGMSPAWRARFVDYVEGLDYVLKGRLKWELSRWIVKEGVKTCNDERYE
jgi:hypothetical protein